MDIAKERIAKWEKGDYISELNLSCLSLETLPDIPTTCRILNCSYNKLTKLPDLPYCISLMCGNNMLTKLPHMPNCVSLQCQNNLLSYIPDKAYNLVTCKNNKYLYINPKMMRRQELLVDERTINYPIFATKIQRAYGKYKRKHIFVELNKFYIKNMARLISLYC